MLGVSHMWVLRSEKGDRRVDVDEAAALARLYRVTLKSLLLPLPRPGRVQQRKSSA